MLMRQLIALRSESRPSSFRKQHHHLLTAQTPDFINHGWASCSERGPTLKYFKLPTASLEEDEFWELNPYQIYKCETITFQPNLTRTIVTINEGMNIGKPS